jgi:hypothetical protein
MSQFALPEDEQEARLRAELIKRNEACRIAENALSNPTTVVFLEEQIKQQNMHHEAQVAFTRALEEWRAYRKTQRDEKERAIKITSP